MCDVSGCGEKHLAKGKCRNHYRQGRYAVGVEGRRAGKPPRDRRYVGGWYGGRFVAVLVEGLPNGGAFVWCPAGCSMTGIRDHGRSWLRWCPLCEEVVQVTGEDVSEMSYESGAAARSYSEGYEVTRWLLRNIGDYLDEGAA